MKKVFLKRSTDLKISGDLGKTDIQTSPQHFFQKNGNKIEIREIVSFSIFGKMSLDVNPDVGQVLKWFFSKSNRSQNFWCCDVKGWELADIFNLPAKQAECEYISQKSLSGVQSAEATKPVTYESRNESRQVAHNTEN